MTDVDLDSKSYEELVAMLSNKPELVFSAERLEMDREYFVGMLNMVIDTKLKEKIRATIVASRASLKPLRDNDLDDWITESLNIILEILPLSEYPRERIIGYKDTGVKPDPVLNLNQYPNLHATVLKTGGDQNNCLVNAFLINMSPGFRARRYFEQIVLATMFRIGPLQTMVEAFPHEDSDTKAKLLKELDGPTELSNDFFDILCNAFSENHIKILVFSQGTGLGAPINTYPLSTIGVSRPFNDEDAVLAILHSGDHFSAVRAPPHDQIGPYYLDPGTANDLVSSVTSGNSSDSNSASGSNSSSSSSAASSTSLPAPRPVFTNPLPTGPVTTPSPSSAESEQSPTSVTPASSSTIEATPSQSSITAPTTGPPPSIAATAATAELPPPPIITIETPAPSSATTTGQANHEALAASLLLLTGALAAHAASSPSSSASSASSSSASSSSSSSASRPATLSTTGTQGAPISVSGTTLSTVPPPTTRPTGSWWPFGRTATATPGRTSAPQGTATAATAATAATGATPPGRTSAPQGTAATRAAPSVRSPAPQGRTATATTATTVPTPQGTAAAAATTDQGPGFPAWATGLLLNIIPICKINEFGRDCADTHLANEFNVAAAYAKAGVIPETSAKLKKYKALLAELNNEQDPAKREVLLTKFNETYRPTTDIRVIDDHDQVYKRDLPNPYRAHAYRRRVTDWNNPTGITDPDEVVMKDMNFQILKDLVPPEIIADKDMAVAILESLWYSGRNPVLDLSPEYDPSVIVGKYRERQNATLQRSQAAHGKEFLKDGDLEELTKMIKKLRGMIKGASYGPLAAAKAAFSTVATSVPSVVINVNVPASPTGNGSRPGSLPNSLTRVLQSASTTAAPSSSSSSSAVPSSSLAALTPSTLSSLAAAAAGLTPSSSSSSSSASAPVTATAATATAVKRPGPLPPIQTRIPNIVPRTTLGGGPPILPGHNLGGGGLGRIPSMRRG